MPPKPPKPAAEKTEAVAGLKKELQEADRLRVMAVSALAWCVGVIDTLEEVELPEEIRDTLHRLEGRPS
jgi:hypothetical protein